jgi:hypothetical protein
MMDGYGSTMSKPVADTGDRGTAIKKIYAGN